LHAAGDHRSKIEEIRALLPSITSRWTRLIDTDIAYLLVGLVLL
jgi:hypothetical protein